MPGADKDSKEESRERSQDSDAIRMLAKELLGKLDQPVHSTRCLKDSGTGDSGNDDVDDIRRRSARLHSEAEDKDRQADARDRAKR